MRALHFGAGNIGKGFIGYLLNKSGYDVCFVDVNQDAIDKFNKKNRYLVELLDDDKTVEVISPVSALNSITQKEEVLSSIVKADIITTSVGIANISRIAESIAKGLLKRIETNKKKIDIIANENAINASSILKIEVEKYFSDEEVKRIREYVGFPNSAIDRLALSKENEEDEVALVEPIFEWVINKSEMVNDDLPYIKGATYVDDLAPYIERKLYCVNMAHVATAYIGFLNGEKIIQDALKNPIVESFVKGALNETTQYLIKEYDIPLEEINIFISKTLARFKNKNIKDDILRVGRSPVRKLGINERIVAPTLKLYEQKCSVKYMTILIASAFLFDNPEDEEAIILQQYIKENGLEKSITHFTGINDEYLVEMIKNNYYQFTNY
jgi:mannitol-1-phosphate 5-dehydrogenase